MKENLLAMVLGIGLLSLMVSAGPMQRVVYVNAGNAAGPWDGKSWATAYRDLQEALQAAQPGEEIWVAGGTYKPTDGTDRTASFRLKPGVALYGGFDGTETRRDQRNWEKNRTTLSGDIGQAGDAGDNSYHVVTGADGATLDGFIVTGGNASGIPRRAGQHLTPGLIVSGRFDDVGGGMLNVACAPAVINCIFEGNTAGKGGAMYNMSARRPGPGGPQPAPRVVNCTFRQNRSGGRGGAVANDLRTSPTFVGCIFVENATGGKGGGMYNDFTCSPTLKNCVFAQNSARRGGGMANDGSSCPVLINCTFTGNYAEDLGGAIYNGTYAAGTPPNSPTIVNCILWGNITPCGPKEISNWHEDCPTVTYCDVEGGYEGEGNISADPLLRAPDNGDWHLSPGSPCIDIGNAAAAPDTDIDGNPCFDTPDAPNGPAAGEPPIDLGAFEWQGRD